MQGTIDNETIIETLMKQNNISREQAESMLAKQQEFTDSIIRMMSEFDAVKTSLLNTRKAMRNLLAITDATLSSKIKSQQAYVNAKDLVAGEL